MLNKDYFCPFLFIYLLRFSIKCVCILYINVCKFRLYDFCGQTDPVKAHLCGPNEPKFRKTFLLVEIVMYTVTVISGGTCFGHVYNRNKFMG